MASGKIDVCLNQLRRIHGDLFWYYPTLTGSRVFVVFDNQAAEGILKDESWIFSKALETWHDRQRSKDPFERLLVDSLLLADGNQHKKRSSQLSGRLSKPHHWALFESSLRDLTKQFLCDPQAADVASFSVLLARDALNHFTDLTLTDTDFELLRQCLPLAGLSMRSQMSCPFRERSRRSTRSQRNAIDGIRDRLRHQLDFSHGISSGQEHPPVRTTNQAVVDESLLIAFSLTEKLPALINAAAQSFSGLTSAVKSQIGTEWEQTLPSPTTEAMAAEWPITVRQFEGISCHCLRPLTLLKRVCVCQALVCGVLLPETTEIWIPSWSSNRLLFGIGRYSCNGEALSWAITGRVIQYWCAGVR